MKRPVPREVQWLHQALRTAIRRSPASHAQIEQELGLRPGSLEPILSGRIELKVAHLFTILRVLGLDFAKLLVLQLREEAP